jgi:sugar (pentulose or hexulose) kinase
VSHITRSFHSTTCPQQDTHVKQQYCPAAAAAAAPAPLTQVPSITSTKLLWLKRHEPEAWGCVAAVMLPHDYINFWLTGHKKTEVSLAN